MNLPEGMTATKLRTIADWLDTYDAMAEQYITIVERSAIKPPPPEDMVKIRETIRSKAIQTDLRAWADEIERDRVESVVANPPPLDTPGFLEERLKHLTEDETS